MSAPQGLVDAAGAGAMAGAVEVIAPPSEAVEWMAEEARPTDLWWNTTVRGVPDCYWHELESNGQIADLVQSLVDPRDTLTMENEPPTRYAQIMLLGDGLFIVEIAERFIDLGAYNWRIGRGRAADEAENDPQGIVQPTQELTAAETIEVLVCWAHGHGLPLSYGAALQVYGHPPDPGLGM